LVPLLLLVNDGVSVSKLQVNETTDSGANLVLVLSHAH